MGSIILVGMDLDRNWLKLWVEAVDELPEYCDAKSKDRNKLVAWIPAITELRNVYQDNSNIRIEDVLYRLVISTEK